MVTAGIVVMVVMMSAMFLFGGHGKKHKHNGHATPEIAVSTSTAVSTSAVQSVAPEKVKDTEHTH